MGRYPAMLDVFWIIFRRKEGKFMFIYNTWQSFNRNDAVPLNDKWATPCVRSLVPTTLTLMLSILERRDMLRDGDM